MNYSDDGWVWRQHIVGKAQSRAILLVTVVGLLVLASGGFVIGLNVGLSLGWLILVFGIALGAGVLGAGLGPTIGSLWVVSLWWFIFPPLIGYLTSSWENSTRYHHPRMLGFGYTSAHAELLGGIEYGVKFGLLLAILIGLVGYSTGAVVSRILTQLKAR
ncbi:hypothetical protein [Halegenticoccus tardaugens]|uniref:hypothetical protein n=1 Tax=Halegenticoccus tardaugens TaxID=2071624 RepID=UPI00100BD576|nr:hypothetical protein [Halegenticoccus tardaugens]